MFIIIDCYLVLHHKYEINVMLCYVMLCYCAYRLPPSEC